MEMFCWSKSSAAFKAQILLSTAHTRTHSGRNDSFLGYEGFTPYAVWWVCKI